MIINIPILLKMLCDTTSIRLGISMHRLFSENKEYSIKNLIKGGLNVIKNDRLVEHDKLFIVNSFIPPINSKAFASILMAVPGRGSDFFLHHVTGKRTAPISIYIAVTAKCMYNCWHCSAAKRNPAGEIDTKNMIDTVRQIQDMGVGIIGFTGGEPLLRTDLEEIIAAIDKRSVCFVFTTGYGLTYERAKRLKAAGLLGIAISIDSVDENEHDRGRGFDGAFQEAIKAIQNCKRAGLYTMSQTVCTKKLLAEDGLVKLAELAKQLGIEEMRIIEPLPCGKLDANKDAMLSQAERDKLIAFHIQCNRNSALPKASVFSYFESQQQFGCGAGVQHSYIDHQGNLYPCDFVPASFGNVLQQPLAKLWKEMHASIGIPRATCLSKVWRKRDDDNCERYPLAAQQIADCEQGNCRDMPDFYKILRGRQ